MEPYFIQRSPIIGTEVLQLDMHGHMTGKDNIIKRSRERSGSVVERLTRDGGAAGSSLTGATVLCP